MLIELGLCPDLNKPHDLYPWHVAAEHITSIRPLKSLHDTSPSPWGPQNRGSIVVVDGAHCIVRGSVREVREKWEKALGHEYAWHKGSLSRPITEQQYRFLETLASLCDKAKTHDGPCGPPVPQIVPTVRCDCGLWLDDPQLGAKCPNCGRVRVQFGARPSSPPCAGWSQVWAGFEARPPLKSYTGWCQVQASDL